MNFNGSLIRYGHEDNPISVENQEELLRQMHNAPSSEITISFKGVRFKNLVPNNERDRLFKTLRYEVLLFHTKGCWDAASDDREIKKAIWSKFRSYDEALEMAKYTLTHHPGAYLVILR